MTKKEHLSNLFKPTHYDVYLDINRANKTFSGKVTMKGQAVKPDIKINEKFLNIASVKVDGKIQLIKLTIRKKPLKFMLEHRERFQLKLDMMQS